MNIRIVTLFPEFFTSPLTTGLLGRAVAGGKISVDLIDIRKYSDDPHRRCDDYPYGGGSGMVLVPGPLFRALDDAALQLSGIIFLSPSGRLLTQSLVKELAAGGEMCLVCGNYEGIDQRVIERYGGREVSIGDYVLSGGEFAALVLLDAVARYAPGFMSNERSLDEESFEDFLLEYPHYSRPAAIEGMQVPQVLLDGDHAAVERWRLERRIEKTRAERPDLYRQYLIRKIRGETK